MQMTPDQVKGIVMFLMPGVVNEQKTTRKLLAATLQEQLGFKLGEKGRTAKELMWHISVADVWFLNSIADLSFGMEEGPKAPGTVREIVDWYETEYAKGVARVSAMTPDQLATPINFYNMYNMPAGIYLNFLVNHQLHHRGQLSTYLRAMNAHVPSIYGGSADEPFEMPATEAASA